MKISVCSLKVQLTLVSEIKEMEILMSIFHLLLKARVENVGDSTFGLGFHVVRIDFVSLTIRNWGILQNYIKANIPFTWGTQRCTLTLLMLF